MTLGARRRSPLLSVTLMAASSAFLAGCSESHDGWFANPCAHPLEVTTRYRQRDAGPNRPDGVIPRDRLRPERVTKIDDAFQTANGFTWFLEIEGGPTLQLDEEDLPNWTVALPASVCDVSSSSELGAFPTGGAIIGW